MMSISDYQLYCLPVIVIPTNDQQMTSLASLIVYLWLLFLASLDDDPSLMILCEACVVFELESINCVIVDDNEGPTETEAANTVHSPHAKYQNFKLN